VGRGDDNVVSAGGFHDKTASVADPQHALRKKVEGMWRRLVYFLAQNSKAFGRV
jgi:hypothetical protein